MQSPVRCSERPDPCTRCATAGELGVRPAPRRGWAAFRRLPHASPPPGNRLTVSPRWLRTPSRRTVAGAGGGRRPIHAIHRPGSRGPSLTLSGIVEVGRSPDGRRKEPARGRRGKRLTCNVLPSLRQPGCPATGPAALRSGPLGPGLPFRGRRPVRLTPRQSPWDTVGYGNPLSKCPREIPLPAQTDQAETAARHCSSRSSTLNGFIRTADSPSWRARTIE